MKLKSIVAASVVALSTLSSHAATASWGQHSQLEVAAGQAVGGLIFDTYSFLLGTRSNVASSVSSTGTIVPAVYSLYSVGNDGVQGTLDDQGIASWTFSSSPAVHTVTLGAGSYYYSVLGLASPGAAYTFSSSATAAPVPEPETYALLAAGLGVIGFVASRRRREH